jgi:hypothetical protein
VLVLFIDGKRGRREIGVCKATAGNRDFSFQCTAVGCGPPDCCASLRTKLVRDEHTLVAIGAGKCLGLALDGDLVLIKPGADHERGARSPLAIFTGTHQHRVRFPFASKRYFPAMALCCSGHVVVPCDGNVERQPMGASLAMSIGSTF